MCQTTEGQLESTHQIEKKNKNHCTAREENEFWLDFYQGKPFLYFFCIKNTITGVDVLKYIAKFSSSVKD